MTNDETELLQRRLTDRVIADVEHSLKRRFTWLGIVAVLATSGALYFTVKGMMADSQVRLHTASEVQEITNRRLSTVTERAEALTKSAEEIRHRLEEDVEISVVRARELSRRAESIASELAKTSQENLTLSRDLLTDIDALLAIVELLPRDSNGETESEISRKMQEIREGLHKVYRHDCRPEWWV